MFTAVSGKKTPQKFIVLWRGHSENNCHEAAEVTRVFHLCPTILAREAFLSEEWKPSHVSHFASALPPPASPESAKSQLRIQRHNTTKNQKAICDLGTKVTSAYVGWQSTPYPFFKLFSHFSLVLFQKVFTTGQLLVNLQARKTNACTHKRLHQKHGNSESHDSGSRQKLNQNLTLLSCWGGGNGVYFFLTFFLKGCFRLLWFFVLKTGRNLSHDSFFNAGSLANSCFIMSVWNENKNCDQHPTLCFLFQLRQTFHCNKPLCCKLDGCSSLCPPQFFSPKSVKQQSHGHQASKCIICPQNLPSFLRSKSPWKCMCTPSSDVNFWCNSYACTWVNTVALYLFQTLVRTNGWHCVSLD